jgi:biotin carboxyl carrier protein
MRYFVTLGAREIPVDVTLSPSGGFDVSVDGRRVDVDAAPAGGALSVRIDGRIVDVVLDGSPPAVAFSALGVSGTATIETDRTRTDALGSAGKSARADQEFIVAPMPGRIVRVLAIVGADVAAGTPMVVIEAMKMENELRATRAGKVTEVLVGAGDAVEGGAKLIRLA